MGHSANYCEVVKRPKDQYQARLETSRLWKLQQAKKNYRMKQSWRQASMQVFNSSVARRQGRLQGRLRARPRGLKAMEIGAKQYDKEGTLFWTSKPKKKQARKNGPSSSISNHLPGILPFRYTCKVLLFVRLRHFSQKRLLQQSHFSEP